MAPTAKTFRTKSEIRGVEYTLARLTNAVSIQNLTPRSTQSTNQNTRRGKLQTQTTGQAMAMQ